MTRQIFWTKKVLETFIEEGNLNERQKEIIRMRASGESISEQACKLNLSIDQVNKEIKELKKIYDVTQKYCDFLPPRKTNKKELFKN